MDQPAATGDLDPRTPVLVGVGQASERPGQPGYQRLSPVGLAADAAVGALVDTGTDPAPVSAAIDTVAGVRQFEISNPAARAPLGRSDARSQYALAENAGRARLKLPRDDYAAAMGALFAPFTQVAAGNPHAAAPTARSAGELITPTESNRLIADTYTRYLVAREKV